MSAVDHWNKVRDGISATVAANIKAGRHPYLGTREPKRLATHYLSKADEDWTWCDPEDVKTLARAVLGK